MPWLREGECPPEHCKGRCCERVGFWLSGGPMSLAAEWLQARGFELHEVGDSLLADIPHRCQHLTGEGLCALHPDLNPSSELPDRPALCDIWPTEPSQIVNHPYCLFEFRWVGEEVGATT